MVHDVAAAGFYDPADYEAARPSYPPEAVAWFVEHLRIEPGRRVVDLAAGTGKLTRLLAPTGADLIAVEPVAGMRDDVPDGCCPSVPLVATHRRAARVPRRVARRDHRRAGVPLVRPRPRDRGARARACVPAAASGSSGTRATAASTGSTRCGRSWTASRSTRRGATTTTGATARYSDCPASARCTPRSSATSRRSRPRRWSSGSRR